MAKLRFWLHVLLDPSFRRMQLLASGKFQRAFPRLYARMRHYVLQTGGAPRYDRFHLILRTTDAVLNVNSGRRLERIGLFSKADVIRMGSGSVALAARTFMEKYGADKLSVSIVTDRLSDAGKVLYEKLFAEIPVAYVSSSAGNANTFRTQIDLALKDDDKTLVAIYEDDYLTDACAFCVAYELFNTTQKLVGFTPHDHPGVLRNASLTRLYRLLGRLYKAVSTTTCTFIIGADFVRRWQKSFYKYDGFEGLSINRVWAKEICLSPCGWTLAEHLHESDLSPFQKLVDSHL